MTLDDLENELRVRGFSEKTVKSYLYHTQKFIDFLSLNDLKIDSQQTLMDKSNRFNLLNIKQKHLKSFISSMLKNQKPSSVNLAISALRFYFTEVLKKPELFIGLKLPKLEKKLPVVLTKKEIKRLISALDNPKHVLLISLLYSSGLRVSEAVSLKIDDLDLDDKTGIIRSGKGKKDRNIILSKSLIRDIRSFLLSRDDNNPFIFNVSDRHISTRQAQKIVSSATIKAGIKKRVFCHSLRSSFATHLLDKGVDIRIIQELLGHSNLATTERYTKVSKERIKSVKSPLDDLS